MSRKGIPVLDFDDLILALQDLAAPSATDVAVSTANMHYITEDDAQGALAELDAECFALNNSLTNLIKQTESTVTTNSSGRVQGTTEALFGVANATILEAYILREPSTLDVMRTAEISTYGSGGYTITCTQTASKTALASQSLKIRFTYCVLS